MNLALQGVAYFDSLAPCLLQSSEGLKARRGLLL
jgi:hypothetical protein